MLAVPDLPADVLPRLFAALRGDVATLCAAACVCRQWRDLAALPALWTALEVHGAAARAALTPRRLAALLDRACGLPLRTLDLTACVRLTAEEVLHALRGRALALSRVSLSGMRLHGPRPSKWSRNSVGLNKALFALTAARLTTADDSDDDGYECYQYEYSSEEEAMEPEQELFVRQHRCAAETASGGACGRLCSVSDAAPNICCEECTGAAYVCAVCAAKAPPGVPPPLAQLTQTVSRAKRVCICCSEDAGYGSYFCGMPGCNVALSYYYWDGYRSECRGCGFNMCHLCCADAWVNDDSDDRYHGAARLCASCAVRMAAKEPERLTSCAVCAKRLYRHRDSDNSRRGYARRGLFREEIDQELRSRAAHASSSDEEARPTAAVIDTSAGSSLPPTCCVACRPEHKRRKASAARAAEQQAAAAADRARDDAHLELPPPAAAAAARTGSRRGERRRASGGACGGIAQQRSAGSAGPAQRKASKQPRSKARRQRRQREPKQKQKLGARLRAELQLQMEALDCFTVERRLRLDGAAEQPTEGTAGIDSSALLPAHAVPTQAHAPTAAPEGDDDCLELPPPLSAAGARAADRRAARRRDNAACCCRVPKPPVRAAGSAPLQPEQLGRRKESSKQRRRAAERRTREPKQKLGAWLRIELTETLAAY